MIELIQPNEGEVVSLLTNLHRDFLSDEEGRAAVSPEKQFSKGPMLGAAPDGSRPAPVCFSWEEEGGGGYALIVSESPDLSEPRRVVLTDEKRVELYNLKTGREYFFCVQKNDVRSEVRAFRTAAETPRCVRIDGIYNVRDAGGYRVEGGVIRQGLVYRGGEFELHSHLTPLGASDVRDLGLRTDLDLRGEASHMAFTVSELIGMRRVLAPARGNGENLDPQFAEGTRAIFRVFADREAYPIYYHCWGGADRTGAIAYLLGAFLGMSKRDLIDDYEMTSLAMWGTRTRNHPSFIAIVDSLDAYEGDTLREKATRALRDTVGMTEEELDTIYDILVERE